MPDPFVIAVRRTLGRFHMVGPGQRVMVAISGGPDSTALLAVLSELARELQIQIAAAHLDHGLRGREGARDAAAARDLAEQLGVPFHCESIAAGTLEAAAGGIEQAARQARYGFLLRIAKENGCDRIATGHTRDDQAETVLFRLLRGSRKPGLGGVQPVRRDGVIRPLIEVSREEVMAYIERRELPFVVDSSNTDLRFARNRIRAEVLPVLRRFNPRIAEHLAALGQTLSSEVRAEDVLAHELLRHYRHGEDGLVLERFSHLPEDVRRSLLRRWLLEARGHLRGVGAAHLEAVDHCISSGREVSLPGGGHVVNEHGVVRFFRENWAAEPRAVPLLPGGCVTFGSRWQIEATPVHRADDAGDAPITLWDAAFDTDQVSMPFRVRPWRSGDRIRPLGMSGHRKLSDVFVDRKVPRAQRRLIPVVEAGGEILWVPGQVRSDTAKLRPSSKYAVRLRAKRS